MALTPYATTEQLNEWLPSDKADPNDADRLILRASERVDEFVVAAFGIDTITGLPKDEIVALSLQEATCAQVEFWLEVGEGHDIDGIGGTVSASGVSYEAPARLAPRARAVLQSAGLMDMGQVGT